MKEAVELIVRAIVDDGDAVQIDEIQRDRSTTVIEVRVAPNDMGRLIGRQGRTVRAIRCLLHATGIKHDHRFILELLE